MHTRVNQGSHPSPTILLRVVWLTVLFLPVTLCLFRGLRPPRAASSVLWLGTLFQLLACALALLSRNSWADMTGSPMIMLYVIALSWMLLGGAGGTDWYLHTSQAILLVV